MEVDLMRIFSRIVYFDNALTNPKIHDLLQTGEIIMRENVSQSKDMLSLDSNIVEDVLPIILHLILWLWRMLCPP